MLQTSRSRKYLPKIEKLRKIHRTNANDIKVNQLAIANTVTFYIKRTIELNGQIETFL